VCLFFYYISVVIANSSLEMSIPFDTMEIDNRKCHVCNGAKDFGKSFICTTNTTRWNNGAATFRDFLPPAAHLLAIQVRLRGHAHCGPKPHIHIDFYLNNWKIDSFESQGKTNCVCGHVCDPKAPSVFAYLPESKAECPYNYDEMNRLYAIYRVVDNDHQTYSCFDSFIVTMIFKEQQNYVKHPPVPLIPPVLSAPPSPTPTKAPAPHPTPTIIHKESHTCCGYSNALQTEFESYCAPFCLDKHCCPHKAQWTLASHKSVASCGDCR